MDANPIDSKSDKIVRPTHTKRGKFAPGNCANPKGRPPVPEIAQLRDALEKKAKETGQSFFDLFVEMAYKHKEVAIALAKKLIPDKIQGEGFGGNGVYIYVIREGKRISVGDQDRIAIPTTSEPAGN